MNISSIPGSVSFVDALARGVLAQYGHDPMVLASVTILLPNRRACRSLRDAFLRESSGTPLLLPTIRPVGDVEEDALFLSAAGDALEVRPAISPLRRRLVLARYLTAARPDQFTTAQALSMANDLGRFLDAAHTENLSLDALDTLVPEDYATHWQINLSFLKDVLRVFWPQHLEAEGVSDMGAYRHGMITAYTRSLAENPPQTPVIAAGSTGPTPALAALLKTVASMPQGQVVLPGLDMLMDEDAWTAIEEGHPQAGLAALLLSMDATRTDVKQWPVAPQTTPRDALVSTLMRPASSLEAWTREPLPQTAWEGLTLLEADTLDEEATAIALMMRAHADDLQQKQPCVLVTPDRILASRVALMLSRWGIAVDDSAGLPLANTPIGQWLQLLARVLAEKQEPVAFLSLLKSSFAGGGANWPSTAPPFRTFTRLVDKHIMRGTRMEEGFGGLLHRAEKQPALATGLTHLKILFDAADTATDTASRLRALVHLAEQLASTPDHMGAARLWAGDAGEAMAEALTMLLEQADILPALDWAGCADLLAASIEGIDIRPRYGTHPRLMILGMIEARLYQCARMILGSLNEGTWPAPAQTDGWMSRDMRKRFGLPAPERAITLAAHDFAQSLGAADVVLTRSKNRDGAPSIPARWLQRLDTLAAAQPYTPDIRSGAGIWLSMAARLDAPLVPAKTILRPAPNPPLHVRPTKLSVTEIGKLRRDPYGIYARHILKLRPLDPIAADPDAADRGTLIHDALMRYGAAFPRDLPDDALPKLLEMGAAEFAAARQHPDVTGHWWPRFVRMAKALIPFERIWRRETLKIYPEITGSIAIATSQGPFTLEGRADRIEERASGWAVIDYKSGSAPAGKKVKSGEEPQLGLLGAMLLHGGFNTAINTSHTPETLSTLAYWKTGGGEDSFKATELKEIEALCAEAKDGVEILVRAYLDEGLAYTCWPDPDNKLRDNYEYAHLARIAEWSQGDDGEWEDAA